MGAVGQIERRRQNRVIALFRYRLKYDLRTWCQTSRFLI